jgi:hypothetical protein
MKFNEFLADELGSVATSTFQPLSRKVWTMDEDATATPSLFGGKVKVATSIESRFEEVIFGRTRNNKPTHASPTG